MSSQHSNISACSSGRRKTKEKPNMYLLDVDDPNFEVILSKEEKDMQKDVYKKLQESKICPIWLTSADVLRIKSRERSDHFVFPKFEGLAFNHLKSLECKDCRIYGTPIIRHYLETGQNLPKRKWHPIWSANLEGAVICFTGLSKEEREEKTRLVEYMLGLVNPDLTESITHLVAESCDPSSSKYLSAASLNIPVLFSTWIDDAWKTACQYNSLKMTDPEIIKMFRIPIFHDCEFTVSGFGREERDNLFQLVEMYGGKYRGEMIKGSCTHLITDLNSGEKYRRAMEWKKFIVTRKWLEKSIAKGIRLREKDFHPAVKCSTPNVSRDAPQLEEPNVSSIGLPQHNKICYDGPSINLNTTSQQTTKSRVANTFSSVNTSSRPTTQRTTTTNHTSVARSTTNTRTLTTLPRPTLLTSSRSATTSTNRNSPTPSNTSLNRSNSSQNRTLVTNTSQQKDPIDDLNLTTLIQVEEVMEGFRLCLCGMTPEILGKYKRLVNKLGATFLAQLDDSVNYVIVGREKLPNEIANKVNRLLTSKIRDLASKNHISVVKPEWLILCVRTRSLANTDDFIHSILSADETIQRHTPGKENTPVSRKSVDSRIIRHASRTFYGEASHSMEIDQARTLQDNPVEVNDDQDSFYDDHVFAEPLPVAEKEDQGVRNEERGVVRGEERMVQKMQDFEILSQGRGDRSFSAPINSRVEYLRRSSRVTNHDRNSLGPAPDMNISHSPSVYVTGQRKFKLRLDLRAAERYIDCMDSPTSSDSLSTSEIGRILDVAVANSGRGMLQIPDEMPITELARDEGIQEQPGPSNIEPDLKMKEVQEKIIQALQMQVQKLRAPLVSRSETPEFNSPKATTQKSAPYSEFMHVDEEVEVQEMDLNTRVTTNSRVVWDEQISTQEALRISAQQVVIDNGISSLNTGGGTTESTPLNETPQKFPSVRSLLLTSQKPSTSKDASVEEIPKNSKKSVPLLTRIAEEDQKERADAVVSDAIATKEVENLSKNTNLKDKEEARWMSTRGRTIRGSATVTPSTPAPSTRLIPSSPPRRTPPPRTVSILQTGSPRKRKADVQIPFPTSPQAKRRAAEESARVQKSVNASNTSLKTARSIPQGKAQEGKNKEKIFMFTSFSSGEPALHVLMDKIKVLGGLVLETEKELARSCTHVICSKFVRNEKIITAISTGKWLLSPDYVHDSMAAQEWLNEEDYEYAVDKYLATLKESEKKLAKSSRRWRLELKNVEKYPSGGAFYGWNVLFYVNPKRANSFVHILEHGGGSGINRESIKSEVDYSEYSHVIIERVDKTIINEEELALLIRARLKCFSPDFLVAYLAEENVNENDYLLPEYKRSI